MDKLAIKDAIYRELYRQGVEFASVIITYHSDPNNFSVGIKQLKTDIGQPDRFCVENQVTPPPPPNFPIPDGLENIRELDLEIHELIKQGYIEKKDCGYALTES